MKKNKEKERIIKKVMKELTFRRPYYIPSQILELFQKELLRVQEETKKETKIKKKIEKSDCCNAKLRYCEDNFSNHWVACSKCGRKCNIKDEKKED